MIHLSVHMPIWGRAETVGMVAAHWEHLREELKGQVQIWPFAVVSPGDPDAVDTAYLASKGWGIISCENKPLGKKWNHGWNEIRRALPSSTYPAQAHMQVGSDNLLTAAYIRKAMRILAIPDVQSGVDHVALDSCIFLNSEDGATGLCTAGGKWGYGPGRIMSVHAMRAMRWNLYKDKQSSKMDGQLDAALQDIGASLRVLPMKPRTTALVDIKGPGSKNDYRKARARRMGSSEWHDLDKGLVPLLFPHLNWPACCLEVDENEG